MNINEQDLAFELTPDRSSIIKVIGVGGGGNNAINYMYKQGIKDVNFVICNTDAQALESSPVTVKVQLGQKLTEGLGAGSNPEKGKQSAIDSIDEIDALLSENTKMVFITAGMGGGTGTGAAPVIAQRAKEMGILTVGIVTLPFKFESRLRYNQAIEGVKALQDKVDSLLLINNEKLREMYGNLPISQAFAKADNILLVAAKGIAEMITGQGYINVDFADVSTIMRNSGLAIMGSACGHGSNRAIDAIHEALNSPLLNNNDITGAKSVLLNVTYGTSEISMDELSDITDYVFNAISEDAHFIWGVGMDESVGDGINVTIVATRFRENNIPDAIKPETRKEVLMLDDKSVPAKDLNSGYQKDKDYDDISIRETSDIKQPVNIDQRNPDIIPGRSNIQPVISPAVKDIVREDPKPFNTVTISPRPARFYDNPGMVDAMENEPAYMRKKIQTNAEPEEDKPDNGKISDFSVGKDGLSTGNPFLNPTKD